jgi:hypothetical protein
MEMNYRVHGIKPFLICVTLSILISISNYAQEANNEIEEEYYDVGTGRELVIYGERQKEFASDSTEALILKQINGNYSDRKQFIEAKFLEDAGFRRTGNAKYRKTESSEKAISVLHGIVSLISFGIVPKKPFMEIEYGKLQKNQFYSFEQVLINSQYANVSYDVLNIMKLEYMLQIEFCNGMVIQDTINNYTDENIFRFEELINKLPDHPESIAQSKKRFMNDLKKIKAALERHRNPSEDYLRAMENLKNSFKIK